MLRILLVFFLKCKIKISFSGSSGSIVVCICPLTVDQCKRFSDKGVVANFVGEAMTDKNVIKEVLEGRVQLLFITPESIILNRLYRNMLLSPVYKKLAVLVIDEEHCVKFWGDQFRQTFALICD